MIHILRFRVEPRRQSEEGILAGRRGEAPKRSSVNQPILKIEQEQELYTPGAVQARRGGGHNGRQRYAASVIDALAQYLEDS